MSTRAGLHEHTSCVLCTAPRLNKAFRLRDVPDLPLRGKSSPVESIAVTATAPHHIRAESSSVKSRECNVDYCCRWIACPTIEQSAAPPPEIVRAQTQNHNQRGKTLAFNALYPSVVRITAFEPTNPPQIPHNAALQALSPLPCRVASFAYTNNLRHQLGILFRSLVLCSAVLSRKPSPTQIASRDRLPENQCKGVTTTTAACYKARSVKRSSPPPHHPPRPKHKPHLLGRTNAKDYTNAVDTTMHLFPSMPSRIQLLIRSAVAGVASFGLQRYRRGHR